MNISYFLLSGKSLNSTLDDVLNVRLQTIGISEHAFKINLGGVAYNWLMYDFPLLHFRFCF
jgi:hypothetical protein